MWPERWGKRMKGVGLWWGLLTPTAHWPRHILLDSDLPPLLGAWFRIGPGESA